MGTFLGHSIGGTVFMCYALWWIFNILNRYFRSLGKNGVPYRSTATFRVRKCCRREGYWEVEGTLKVLISTLGVIGELITGVQDGHFVWIGNLQHVSIYISFGLTGIVDLLLVYGVPLPKKSSYMTMMFSLFIQTMVFRFHLDARPDLDVLLHTITMYVIILELLAWLAEMVYDTSVYPALARAYFMFAQGTTLWQAGFMLFNPFPNAKPWDDEAPDTIMVTTAIFTWHLTLDLVLFLGIALFIGRLYRQTIAENTDNQSYDLLKVSHNGVKVNVAEDSDSDIESNLPLTRMDTL